jgi:hypothetical protein
LSAKDLNNTEFYTEMCLKEDAFHYTRVLFRQVSFIFISVYMSPCEENTSVMYKVTEWIKR